MAVHETIGFLAGTLTTIAFLPQVIKVYRTKSAEDISWIMMLLFITGVALWIVYGFTLTDGMPIIVANVFTFILAAAILLLKLSYKLSKPRDK